MSTIASIDLNESNAKNISVSWQYKFSSMRRLARGRNQSVSSHAQRAYYRLILLLLQRMRQNRIERIKNSVETEIGSLEFLHLCRVQCVAAPTNMPHRCATATMTTTP